MIKCLCLVAFALFIIGMARPAHAQWAFQNSMVTGAPPPPLPSGAGYTSSPSACAAVLSSNNYLNLTFTTNLYWSGPGQPTSNATITAVATVSGSAGAMSTSLSNSKATVPAAQANGSSVNGNSYSPAPDTEFVGGQLAQQLTATLVVQVNGSGSANASIAYSAK